MTSREMLALLDSTGLLTIDQAGGTLRVPVTITDCRESFGRDDVLVTPVGGSGTAWVNLDRIDREART